MSQNAAAKVLDTFTASKWQPRPESKKLLDYAMAKIQSVPYKVSSRWTFYRVLQAGLIPSKKYITRFDYLTSRARKEFYGDWRPDTLTDSVRQADFKGELNIGYNVELDTIAHQEFYVQIWFEAEAMHEQFEFHTQNYRVTLIPFRGDCSIPIKWAIAKKLEQISEKYSKPVKVLYFGDRDDKGEQILLAALKDISAWCKIHFDVERVGLTLEQAQEFNLPQNPESPGTYQWEALEDEHAKKLILDALAQYQRTIPTELEERERGLQGKIRGKIQEILRTELWEMP